MAKNAPKTATAWKLIYINSFKNRVGHGKSSFTHAFANPASLLLVGSTIENERFFFNHKSNKVFTRLGN